MLDTNGCSVYRSWVTEVVPRAAVKRPGDVTDTYQEASMSKNDTPRVNPLACPLLGRRAHDRTGDFRQVCELGWGHEGPCRWRWV